MVKELELVQRGAGFSKRTRSNFMQVRRTKFIKLFSDFSFFFLKMFSTIGPFKGYAHSICGSLNENARDREKKRDREFSRYENR